MRIVLDLTRFEKQRLEVIAERKGTRVISYVHSLIADAIETEEKLRTLRADQTLQKTLW